jgi:hypothetical protein
MPRGQGRRRVTIRQNRDVVADYRANQTIAK